MSDGPWQLAVIDPPWRWQAWGKRNNREVPYETMTIDDLAATDICSLLTPDAVVLLWVIDPMLPHAMRIVDTWGLKYATVGFYWTKYRPSGAEHIGTGYYTRANPEQAWLLVRGKGLPRIDQSVRRWLHAPVGAHSQKPDEFFARAARLFGAVSKVEIFARTRRPGWDALGREIDGRDIRDVAGTSTKRFATTTCRPDDAGDV